MSCYTTDIESLQAQLAKAQSHNERQRESERKAEEYARRRDDCLRQAERLMQESKQHQQKIEDLAASRAPIIDTAPLQGAIADALMEDVAK